MPGNPVKDPAADGRIRRGITILRVALASIFVIHGVTRAARGIVDDFGTFLQLSGLPGGTAIAWTITVVEILGGAVLALGLGVRPLALSHSREVRHRLGHRSGPRQGGCPALSSFISSKFT